MNSSQPPIVRSSAPVSASSQETDGLSKAELDRIKAEELIASFSDAPAEDSTFISIADDADLEPGDFAAADPYVSSDETAAASRRYGAVALPNPLEIKSLVANDGNEGISESAEADGKSNSPISPVEATNGDRNLNSPPASGPTGDARTVDEILSTIPGYQPESPPLSSDLSVDAKQPEQTRAEAGNLPEPQTEAGLSAAQTPADPTSLIPETLNVPEIKKPIVELATPIGLPKNVEGQLEEVPVSWFAGEAQQESGSNPVGAAIGGTVEPMGLADSGALSAIVDPVSGEAAFDVRDFSEMADVKIQPIPNAYSETTDAQVASSVADSQPASFQPASFQPASFQPSDVAEETIHSPLSKISDQEIPASDSEAMSSVEPAIEPTESKEEPATEAEPALSVPSLDAEKPKKPIPVTTIMPVNQQSFVASAASNEGSTSGLVFSDSSTLESAASLAPEPSSAPEVAVASTAASAALSSLLKPTDGNDSAPAKFAKTPPPAPTIQDSEIAAAFANCGDIPEPIPEYGIPEFSEETFDEPEFSELPREEELERKSDDTFLVDEGEVIVINGNDGYEFIDLACFERDVATVESGRIIIEDENSAAFEVHYKNIDYVLFAGGVTIDLPPVTS